MKTQRFVRLLARLPERALDAIGRVASNVSGAIEDAQLEAHYRNHPEPKENPHPVGTVQHIAWNDSVRVRRQLCKVIATPNPLYNLDERGLFSPQAGAAVRTIIVERQ